MVLKAVKIQSGEARQRPPFILLMSIIVGMITLSLIIKLCRNWLHNNRRAVRINAQGQPLIPEGAAFPAGWVLPAVRFVPVQLIVPVEPVAPVDQPEEWLLEDVFDLPVYNNVIENEHNAEGPERDEVAELDEFDEDVGDQVYDNESDYESDLDQASEDGDLPVFNGIAEFEHVAAANNVPMQHAPPYLPRVRADRANNVRRRYTEGDGDH